MATIIRSAEELLALVGKEVGTTDWRQIDQQQINLFADATGDQQWIHIDTERAAAGSFGSTIAHGYLVLALLPELVDELLQFEDIEMKINYGSNKVRFVNPVKVDSRIRCTTRVVSVTERGDALQAVYENVIEIEGADKPACVAETITLYRF